MIVVGKTAKAPGFKFPEVLASAPMEWSNECWPLPLIGTSRTFAYVRVESEMRRITDFAPGE